MKLGAVNCDPYWSELNGACSDEFGNYLRPDGTPILTHELVAMLQGKVRAAASTFNLDGVKAWILAHQQEVLIGSAALFVLMLFRRRR